MDEDDLPPRPVQKPPEQTEGFAQSLGELAGASIWVMLFLAIAGAILYFILRVTH